jgi:hypothetical protein
LAAVPDGGIRTETNPHGYAISLRLSVAASPLISADRVCTLFTPLWAALRFGPREWSVFELSARATSAAAALLGVAALVIAAGLVIGAYEQVFGFWAWPSFAGSVAAGMSSGAAVFVCKPTVLRGVGGLALGTAVGFATYVCVVIATFTWWQA